ncbi:sugar ABC transporter substrate-binding protein [Paraburkholderia lacunae]|uniref:Sugar ABC transporter substrate-binding protein n=2 Tax=Paraburkholderia lacunae TaxID=2211104 RepID=A0A370N1K9_9BURK|nr:sugar ABC transporter substrate-binding protein [Paraburkholderia lacunae]
MHMSNPSALSVADMPVRDMQASDAPVRGASASKRAAADGEPAAQAEPLPVPISDIDVALIRKLKEEAAHSAAVEPRLFGTPEAYTLGAGDVLQITVWDHPELAAAQGAQGQAQVRPADAPSGFVVEQNGTIAFPYAGNLNVAGMRVDEVQAQLARRLVRVFREPQVTVRVASFRSKKVYIDGEVHAPGVQPINDIPMTLYEAITRAGGFTPAADQSRMELVREGVAYPLDLPQMLLGKQGPAKLLLKDGDLLRVVSRDENGVFVMGEINRPTTAVPLKSGKLTLNDALSQAGSVNVNTANAAQMYVIRGGENKRAQVFHLDGSSPVSMVLANQFELQPKDIVYVDSTGLARFSRVLGQLLPAINAGLTAAVVTR